MVLCGLAVRTKKKWQCTLPLLVVMSGMLMACGKERQPESGNAEAQPVVVEDFGEGQSIADGEVTAGISEEPPAAEADEPENPAGDEIKNRFGENCISGQTFEVELSEYDGKVWFVPYAPTEEGQQLDVQIVRDGEILTHLSPYVPYDLEGQPFTSLDAVSFFDMNYDKNTDIVLIETYGDTRFAAVYYGFDEDADEDARVFDARWELSKGITDKVVPLTIGELRDRLGEKKSDETASYREAYMAILRLWELESGSEVTGNFIYVDGDDIPEMSVGKNGYWVSLYTFHDGKVYTLMDWWSYGISGNVGYEYIPYESRIRYYNSAYAGLIHCVTYMTVTPWYSLDEVTQIDTYFFDDANGNGMPEEDEVGEPGEYDVSYVDGEEITTEQYNAYDAGAYESISGSMSLEDMMADLGG